MMGGEAFTCGTGEPRLRSKRLSILFVGPVLPGSTTLQRLRALQDLGCRTVSVSSKEDPAALIHKPPLLRRLCNRMLGPGDPLRVNDRMRAHVERDAFDLVWIEKGLMVRPESLAFIRQRQPHCRLVGFSPDDMMNKGNQSKFFLQGLSLYHHFITTKSFHVTELRALGCPDVIFMDNAYDPHTHRPVPVSETERAAYGGAVGFIGTWEDDRAQHISALARGGVSVRVWGGAWRQMRPVPAGLRLEDRHLLGDDYAKGICSFDINLCFLRKCNRDLQTTRSVEIPACGAFMLAERSEEHLLLFKEGVEAEFFSSPHELLEKTQYYLQHPEQRKTIAEGGYHRCVSSGYSYRERLKAVLAGNVGLI